jgi:hypothetical protein
MADGGAIPEGAAAAAAAGGWVPVPDPTKLTTDAVAVAVAQLRREQAALDEGFRREVANVQAIIEARLDAMDKAMDLRLTTIHDAPELWRREVDHLAELSDEKLDALAKQVSEKFNSIGLQFLERDIRSTQASEASAQALAAALQAAKELVGAQGEASAAAAVKAETSFTKQIDQIGVLVAGLDKSMSDRTSTVEKSLTDRILELKERIDRGDTGGYGQGETAAVSDARAIAAAQLAVANHQQGSVANRISANALLASAVGLMITVGGIIVAVILARH